MEKNFDVSRNDKGKYEVHLNITGNFMFETDSRKVADSIIAALEMTMPNIKSYEDCNFCCGDVNERDYLISNGEVGVYIDGNNNLEDANESYLEGAKLNYCPMCGWKL